MQHAWSHFGATLFSPLAQTDSIFSILLVAAWFTMLWCLRYSGYGIALLAVVGTILHEFAHWLVGLVLMARPVSVNLFPRREGRGWVFGSVEFTGLNLFNSAFVAFAPVLLLGVAWGVFAWWLVPAFLAGHYFSWVMGGYVAACALFSSIPSITDIRLGTMSALMYGSVGYGLWYWVHRPV